MDDASQDGEWAATLFELVELAPNVVSALSVPPSTPESTVGTSRPGGRTDIRESSYYVSKADI